MLKRVAPAQQKSFESPKFYFKGDTGRIISKQNYICLLFLLMKKSSKRNSGCNTCIASQTLCQWFRTAGPSLLIRSCCDVLVSLAHHRWSSVHNTLDPCNNTIKSVIGFEFGLSHCFIIYMSWKGVRRKKSQGWGRRSGTPPPLGEKAQKKMHWFAQAFGRGRG